MREAAAGGERDPLPPELSRVLADVAEGRDTAAALERSGHAPEQGLAALAALELPGTCGGRPAGASWS